MVWLGTLSLTRPFHFTEGEKGSEETLEKNLFTVVVLKPSRTLRGPPRYKMLPCPLFLVCRKAVVSQASPESQKSRLKQFMIRTMESQNL